ncbi:MAG TPA: hypothetical protein VN841_26005 [Bryobacteraceae bacterium]|nr:hypothetical protein [Bryobacteraceae bacterium]
MSAFAQIESGSRGIDPTVGLNAAQRQAQQGLRRFGAVVNTGNQITYQGGPVMHTVNAYYIWYGNWAQDPNANAILTAFISSIGGSPYFNINTTYGDTTGNVPNAVTYSGFFNDAGSQGTNLSDASLWLVMTHAFTNGLAVDPNAVYFVLTAPGVTESSGFLTQYCGFHTHNTYNTVDIKYAFIGDPGASIATCATHNTSTSPNGDPQADEMASVVAHELDETVTDEDLNAWYFTSGPLIGDENADACAYTYGTTYAAANSSIANMHLGTRDFLIQEVWLNANGGLCAQSFGGADFTISVAPTSQGVPTGGGTTGNYIVSVLPVNGFTGTVHCTVTGLPSGVTVNGINAKGPCNAPVPTAAPRTGAPLAGIPMTLTVAATVANGSYPFTITGTSGTITHSTPATLVVGAATPAFTLTPNPQTLTVEPALAFAANSTITVQSINGFNSAVALTVTGCPANTVCAITTPVTPPANSSVPAPLTITPSSSTPVGNFLLTISGNAGAATTTVNLQVQDFALSPVPSPVIVNQGSTGFSSVFVQSLNGLTQPVTVAVGGCPANTTCLFPNQQSSIVLTPAPNGTVGVPLAIATSLTTPVGPTTLLITASTTGNAGVNVHTANVSLTVTQIPDFSISANPTSITFSKSLNGHGSTTLTLTSLNGFAGNVTLSALQCPGGCTLTSPVTLTSGGAVPVVLTVSASAKSPPSSGVMSVVATSGPLIHQLFIPFTIAP